MPLDYYANLFKELGHPTRLAIYKYLVKAGHDGVMVSELQQHLDIPASTLSHHIAALRSATLIRQHRYGRTLFCIAEYETLDKLLLFLQDECCLGRVNKDG